MQDSRPFGSKYERSIGVRASNNKNPESENDDNPLRASKMKDLKHPAKSLYQNELNLKDEIKASEEDYHMVTGSYQQLHRQRSLKERQNPTPAKIHISQQKNNSIQLIKLQ